MRRTLAIALVSALAAAVTLISGAGNAKPERSSLVTMTDPVQLARLSERSVHFSSPSFQNAVLRSVRDSAVSRARIPIKDRERQPNPNACTLVLPCVGDPRLDAFEKSPRTRVVPVLFTARSGATLSGHLWAMRAGPKKRPLVIILNGSLIDFEEGHWPQAQALARAGYVVLTFDPQGEGASDQFGEGRDRTDSVGAGLPGTPHNGRPFYDGLEDSLDFALSTPARRYRPQPSSGSGTSHAAKQERRVRAGLNAGYNPLWSMVDRRTVGVAGYSYGAVAASYLAQEDRRIDAVVAWDSLCYPAQPSPDEVKGLFFSNATTVVPGLRLPLAAQIPETCFGAPAGTAPRPRVPSLGISADFVLPGLAQSSDPRSKAAASRRYSKAGVDSGQIVIQGGSHADFVFVGSIPLLPATYRGLDLTTWYTLAWFDKYLRNLPSADRRFMSDRWRHDAGTKLVDPVHDANAYSQLFDSRISITLPGRERWTCEDLRRGCRGEVRSTGGPFDYASFVSR